MMIRRDSGKVSDACVGIYRRTSDYLTNLFVSFSGILHENIDGNTMKARRLFLVHYYLIIAKRVSLWVKPPKPRHF